MDDYYQGEKKVIVTKDVGFNKSELISPENRQKSRERMNNPNIASGKYKLKEIFADIGITVIPEKMTFWYWFTE